MDEAVQALDEGGMVRKLPRRQIWLLHVGEEDLDGGADQLPMGGEHAPFAA